MCSALQGGQTRHVTSLREYSWKIWRWSYLSQLSSSSTQNSPLLGHRGIACHEFQGGSLMELIYLVYHSLHLLTRLCIGNCLFVMAMGGGGAAKAKLHWQIVVVEPWGGRPTGVVLKVQVTGSDSNLHACQSKPVVIYNSLYNLNEDESVLSILTLTVVSLLIPLHSTRSNH